MLQILLMNYGVRKMPLITRAKLRSHFQRVENMNLRTGTINSLRLGRDEVGIKLVFTALHRHIGACSTEHRHKSADIVPLLLGALF